MADSTPQLDAALSPANIGANLRVKVVPNASRSRLAGMLSDRLKVQLAAPPEDGKANKALCDLLAKKLDVKRSDITVTAGHKQPQKTLTITALTPAQVTDRLKPGK